MTKIIFLFLISIQFLILTYLQFTAWPEALSYPFLLNHGFLLYKDFALPYQPLLIFILSSIYQIFGYNILVLKIFTYLIILFADIFIFLISQKLLGKKLISIVPISLYIFLQPLLQGNQLWFDLATVPFVFLGIWFFIKMEGKKRFFLMGFFLSLAFLVKQQVAVVFVLLGFYFLIKLRKSVPIFVLGAAVPIIITFVYILLTGTLKDYIFWTTTVPLVWYPKFPGYTHLPSRYEIIETILLFGPGIFWGLVNFTKIDLKERVIFLIFLGLFIPAFPRFEFFRFQEALASYILLVVCLFFKKTAQFTTVVGASLVIIVLLIRANFGNIPDRFYSEEINFSNYLSQLTSPTDKIYLLGAPSIDYVLANRLPPKPWVDNYVWYMEITGIQDQIIQGFRVDPPKIIVWQTPQAGNWYDQGTYQPKKLTQFINTNYHQTAILGQREIWQKN